MNTYWGGAVSGIAGCLVFGALPRFAIARTDLPRTSDAILLGLGLGLQLLTRPFEFVLLVAIVLLFFVPVRSLAIAALVLLPAFGLTADTEQTGHRQLDDTAVSTEPLSIRNAHDVHVSAEPGPPSPADCRTADRLRRADAAHNEPDLGQRVRLLGFFFLAAAVSGVARFSAGVEGVALPSVAAAIAIFWLGDAFYPYFYPHYIAAATCLFLLVSVKGWN